MIPLFHALILFMSLCLLLILLSAFDTHFVIRLIYVKTCKTQKQKMMHDCSFKEFYFSLQLHSSTNCSRVSGDRNIGIMILLSV